MRYIISIRAKADYNVHLLCSNNLTYSMLLIVIWHLRSVYKCAYELPL